MAQTYFAVVSQAVARQEELVGTGEIAIMLGVGQSRADQLSREKDFPEPVGIVSGRRVWRKADVFQWAKQKGRTIT